MSNNCIRRDSGKVIVYYVFIAFIIILCAGGNTHAQKITTFQKTYGGSSADYGLDLVETADAGMLTVGITASYGSGGHDLMLLRIDSLGRKVWSKTYGGSADEGIANAFGTTTFWANIIQVEDSNYVICSSTKSYGSGGQDIYLLKIDKNGNVIWTRTYGGSGDDAATRIQLLANGGYILVGETKSYGAGNSDVILIETNDTGGVVWSKTYGGTAEDVAFDVQISLDSFYLISGYTYSFGTTGCDFYVLKVNKQGQTIWSKAFGGSNWDLSFDITELPDRSIYVAGQSQTFVIGTVGVDNDLYLLKLDSGGNFKWAKNIGGSARDGAVDLIYDDGHLHWTAWGGSFTGGAAHYYLKLDTSGAVKQFVAHATGTSHLHFIKRLKNKGFAFLHSTSAFGNGGSDMYLIKTDSQGKTSSCNNNTYTPTVQSNKPTITNTNTQVSKPTLNISKGGTVKTITVGEYFKCEPFVSYFTWKGNCQGVAIQFTDETHKGGASWKWNFGDKSTLADTSVKQNPTYIYNDTGIYEVTIIVKKGTNLDSFKRSITIYPSPIAEITTKDTTLCFGDSVTLSTGATAGTFYWSPGKYLNDSLAQQPVAKTYTNTNFILTVTNSGGCKAYDTVSVKIDTAATKCNNLSKAGGIINSYAQVTYIDTCKNALTVDNAKGFAVGDKILLIQMKGADIDTSNTSDFGKIVKYNSAGKNEYVIIDSIGGKNIYSKYSLLHDYDVSAAVQIVSVPQYVDLYITKTITAPAWDGKTGGIVIFEASGTVYLNDTIDVSGKGFRGGAIATTSLTCGETGYKYNNTSTSGANKGEGITVFKNSYTRGRGALANGGGGGNSNKSGGGGGANVGLGGIGGKESSTCTTPISNGGIGGNKILIDSVANRLFFGGGGGAGNNSSSNGTAGANGGGIIIIKAGTLVGNNKYILANGNSPKNQSGVDGAGGGGAGGTILLDVKAFSGLLLYGFKGGDGGKNAAISCYGPGGGGSGGLIKTTISFPSSNLNHYKNLTYGNAGIHTNSSSTCYNQSNNATDGEKGLTAGDAEFIKISNTPSIRPKGHANKVAPVCSGDSALLSATGGVSYIWYPGKMLKDSTKQNTKAKIDKKTTFYVRIYDSKGCFKLDSVVADIKNPPTLTAPTLSCISVTNDTTITVNWVPNLGSDSASFGSYVIYRKTKWTTYELYGTVTDINKTSFNDTKAKRTDTSTYIYQARTFNSCGKGGSFSLEGNNVILTLNRASATEVNLSWTKPAFLFNGFYVIEGDNGSGFKKIKETKSLSDKVGFCNFNGKFRIAIYDTVKKCVAYSNVSKSILLKDSYKPDKPKIISATVENWSTIKITYKRVDSADAKKYHILRSINGGLFSKVTSIDATSVNEFEDKTVSANTNFYCYRVFVEDSCGNISDTSTVHCVVNLAASAGNMRSFLNWNLYKGFGTIKEQHVERTILGDPWKQIAKLSSSATSYTDSVSLVCNKDYFYRIVTLESGGDTAKSYSDTIKVTAFDTSSPTKVPLLGVSWNAAGGIDVKWKTISDPNVITYRIYHSVDGNAYTLVDSLPQNSGTLTFKHSYTGMPVNKTHCYYIEVVNRCSNRKSASDKHCLHYIKNISSNGKREVILGWTPYSGFTVDRYVIQRGTGTSPSSYKNVDSVNANTFTFTDKNLSCEWYSYRILAKEKNGNKFIAYSDTLHVQAFDSFPPLEVNMRYINVVDKNTIQIAFDKSAEKDVIKYEIYYSEDGGAYSQITTLTKPSSSLITHTHSFSQINTESKVYSYKVIAVDSCMGLKSQTSEEHFSILLTGAAGNYSSVLKWTKYRGFTVKSYKVQRKNGSSWVDLATVTDTNYIHAPIPCNQLQTYRIIAVEDGGKGDQSVSNELKITPYDTEVPNAPSIKSVTVQNGRPYIQWTKSTSNDVKNYIIYRYNGSTYTQLTKVGNVDTFTDVSADASKSAYCYKIAAEDSCAKNVSTQSGAHCTIYLQTITDGCKQEIKLNWTAYSGWAGINKIEVYRSENGGSESLLTSLASSATTYTDAGLDYHKNYCYRILAYETGGTIVSWSNISCNETYFVDTAHIYTASKIVTSATNGSVVIKWRSEKGKRYISHHKLYHATSAGGPFILVDGNIPVSKDSFVHTGINTRTGAHFYYLQTVDSCGTVSDKSSTHKTMDIEVEIGQLIHDISWTHYEGFTVSEYYIQRLTGGVFIDIDTVPAIDTFNRRFPAPCNFNISYRMAVKSPEGYFAYSDTMGRTAIDTVFANAAAIHNLTVTSGNGTKLTFRGSDSVDVYAYTIQRSEDGSWGTAGQVLFSTPGDTHNYNDVVNTQEKQLCYTIITLDSCLNATLTDTFCAIQLKGTELNLENELAWQKFKGYNSNKYSVLIYNGSGWDTLTVNNASDTGHLHTPLSCNVPKTYKIAAEELSGSRITLSDSITLVPFDTIKPPQPEIFYSTIIDESSAYMAWQKNASDVKLYELSVKNGAANWQIIDTVENILEHTFGGLNTMDSAYEFRVRAIDSCSANTSIFSEIHGTVQLRGEPKNLANQLNWNAYKGFGVQQYYIYIYDTAWKLLDSTTNTSYTHEPLACNVPQWYKISTLSADGYISWSDSLMLVPFDTIIPAQPQIHYATVQNDRNIKLSWQWDTASDVKYFDIYRKLNNFAYSKLTTVVYDSVYIDSAVSPQRNYYTYYIVAVDSCNILNRSIASASHKTINTRITTGACVPLANLFWTPYTDLPGGVDYYEIYRKAESETDFSLVKVIDKNTYAYVDSTVGLTEIYFYKIKAVDNESGYISWSDSIGILPWQFPDPQQPKMLYASVKRSNASNGSIQIEWEKYDNVADTFARGYRLYHRSATGNFALIHQETDFDKTSYIHTGINTESALHEYYVSVFNLCDVEGLPGDTQRAVNIVVENKNLLAEIKWFTYKGVPVNAYSLFRSHNGGTPRLVGTFTAGDTSYNDSNLFCGHKYKYTVVSTLANGRNSYSDTVEITAFDTIAPANPVLYYVSVDTTLETKGKVSMRWLGNNEVNRSGYRIYRSENGGPLTLHQILYSTKTDTIFWEDVNLNTRSIFYSYHISAIDSCGNESGASQTHNTVYLDVTPMSEYMQLNWSAYTNWQNWNYAIERQETNLPWRVIAMVDSSVLSYRDSLVKCHAIYKYRVRAVDNNFNFISFSNTDVDTAFESVVPAPPVIARASVVATDSLFGQVNLEWSKSASNDAQYYQIYRSVDGVNWNLLVVKFSLFHVDQFLNTAGVSYYYRINSIDSCGNVGTVYSTPHKTILLKTFSANSAANLSWTAYQGFKVKQYDIYRDGQKYFSVPGNVTTFADSAVICIDTYAYYVVAVADTNITIEAASNISNIKPSRSNKPNPVYIETVTVTDPNKTVTLKWTTFNTFDVKHYYIYRRSGHNGRISLIDSVQGLTYTDVRDTIDISDCYFVHAVDYCGNTSNASNPGCIIMLNGRSENGIHYINWNTYYQWKDGVKGYKVYKRSDNNAWVEIGYTEDSVTGFKDILLPNDTTISHCYQVEALENEGTYNASARSTVFCLYQDPIVFVPNIFSPGRSENINDGFGPKGTYLRSYTMEIYNRWGQLVYRTENSELWDGKIMGEVAPDGVYLYVITAKALSQLGTSEKRLKGTVTILR